MEKFEKNELSHIEEEKFIGERNLQVSQKCDHAANELRSYLENLKLEDRSAFVTTLSELAKPLYNNENLSKNPIVYSPDGEVRGYKEEKVFGTYYYVRDPELKTLMNTIIDNKKKLCKNR